jgi:hypothetical protein
MNLTGGNSGSVGGRTMYLFVSIELFTTSYSVLKRKRKKQAIKMKLS